MILYNLISIMWRCQSHGQCKWVKSEDCIPHLVFHAVSTLGSINFAVFDKTLFIHINIAYKVWLLMFNYRYVLLCSDDSLWFEVLYEEHLAMSVIWTHHISADRQWKKHEGKDWVYSSGEPIVYRSSYLPFCITMWCFTCVMR
jgi:hypothetical protein